MRKALAWVVFVAVLLGLAKLATAVGNPWGAANVMGPSESIRLRAEALRIPGCLDHPEACK